MEYFNEKTKLYDITSKYPETIQVFVNNGFTQMDSEEQRKKYGSTIDLKTALSMKQIDLNIFENILNEAIGQNSTSDVTLSKGKGVRGDSVLNIVGLLPCPVRIPLLEEFTSFAKNIEKSGLQLNYELKAASMGLQWVEQNICGAENPDDLPDMFISAGFDMFFDEKRIGKFKKSGVFEDITGINSFNHSFCEIELKDPRKHYGMIGVVPAVFLINKDELGVRDEPKSWADILKPEFENRVSLPVGDFDLFNGILLNIHKNYGDEGVKKLGRSLLESMHPSQMVKSDKKKENRPIVTIMPWFFTNMVREGGSMVAVWPEDGAIISPIFLLAKGARGEALKPIADFFTSKKIGEILSHNGRFPSVNPEVDNGIPEGKKFMWLGWDYIYENDISALIKHCEDVFNTALMKEAD